MQIDVLFPLPISFRTHRYITFAGNVAIKRVHDRKEIRRSEVEEVISLHRVNYCVSL